jgi:myo-inositol-1(or 4)-monophosphatase
MRYSANLNIILKAIEKACKHISRDFVELENLQSNPLSANKFAISCQEKVKQILLSEFQKFRPDFNIFFDEKNQIIVNPNAEYCLIIKAIDGLANLARANGDFTTSVALQYKNKNQQFETVAVAIFKNIGNEVFYAEKGFGAYLNNRRIRVSKRSGGDVLFGCNNLDFLPENYQQLRCYGCQTLEVAYLASARLEELHYSAQNLNNIEPFFLLAKEAGGKINKQDNFTIIGC